MQAELDKKKIDHGPEEDKEVKIISILEGIRENDPKAMPEFLKMYSNTIYSFPIWFYNFSEDEAETFIYTFSSIYRMEKNF